MLKNKEFSAACLAASRETSFHEMAAASTQRRARWPASTAAGFLAL